MRAATVDLSRLSLCAGAVCGGRRMSVTAGLTSPMISSVKGQGQGRFGVYGGRYVQSRDADGGARRSRSRPTLSPTPDPSFHAELDGGCCTTIAARADPPLLCQTDVRAAWWRKDISEARGPVCTPARLQDQQQRPWLQGLLARRMGKQRELLLKPAPVSTASPPPPSARSSASNVVIYMGEEDMLPPGS